MLRFWLVLMVVLGVGDGFARANTINFEQFANGTAITNQYAGVFFSGAQEETSAGVAALLAYTPHSGSGFLSNVTANTIQATFSSLQSSVSGYYSAFSGMTIVAYDAGGSVLSSQTLAASLTNDTRWSVNGSGIASVSFTAPAGTVALDDMTYTTPMGVVPEPAALLLMGTGLCSGAGMCVYRASRVKRAVLREIRCGLSSGEV